MAKEVPETDSGYFYVHQKVTYEQVGFFGLRKYKDVMIPTLFLPLNTSLISDDFSPIKKEDWKRIVSDFASFVVVQEKASENSASGILSLSFSELVSGNLEKAYILSVVALEEAVKVFYKRIEELGTDTLKTKWQRKKQKLYDTIEDLRDNVDYREFGFPDNPTYKNTMKAILDLIHQRNAIVHRKDPKHVKSQQGWYSSLGWSKYVPRTPAEKKSFV